MEPPEPVKRCLPDLWNIFMWLKDQTGPQDYLVKVYCKRFPGKEAAIINQALIVILQSSGLINDFRKPADPSDN